MTNRRILFSFISMVLSLFAFVVATFAWFAISNQVNNSPINFSVDPGIIESYEIRYFTADDVYMYNPNGDTNTQIKVFDNGVTNFDGNDTIALLYNGSVIDVVGNIGINNTFGQNVTLVRKASISSPTSTYSPSQWDSYTQDTVAYIGSHTMTSSASNLIISEYGEGSGYNKWIEIYNNTGSDVNLSNYSINLYSNGSTYATKTLELTGILANQNAYVIANSEASIQAIIDAADMLLGWTYPMYTNVDDLGYSFNGIMLKEYDPLISQNNFENDIYVELYLKYKVDVDNSNISIIADTSEAIANSAIQEFNSGVDPGTYLSDVMYIQNLTTFSYSYDLGSGSLNRLTQLDDSNSPVSDENHDNLYDSLTATFEKENAVVLKHSSSVIDTIGLVGNDYTLPQNVTLVRNANISSPSSVFTTSQWSSYALTPTTYLGSHTMTNTGSASDLIISEYGEGSGNNSWLEIYNGTGVSVNLSAYSIELYQNSSLTPAQTLTLSGTLNNGAVYVIANPQANTTITGLSNTTSSVVAFETADSFLQNTFEPNFDNKNSSIDFIDPSSNPITLTEPSGEFLVYFHFYYNETAILENLGLGSNITLENVPIVRFYQDISIRIREEVGG